MNFTELFEAYYNLYRAEADTPAATDDEYTVAIRLANEAINRWANYDGTYWKELFTTNQLDNSSGTQTITTGTSIYTAPVNFKEAGGTIRITNTDGTARTYPIIETNEVQFQADGANYAYFRPNLTYYSTGTASQATTVITGVGTTWTADMVGMEFQFVTGETATISAFVNATTLTASVSQTVASGTYRIISRKYNLVLNPVPDDAINGMNIDYDYYQKPTLITNGETITECPEPYFIINRMLAQRFRISRNPYYSSAKADAEDALKTMQMSNNSGSWANPWKVADNSGSSWGM
jgi:hypothetical protein